MAGQKVNIVAVIENEDGSKFADLTLNYYDVPREGVLAVEEQLIGMQSGLLDVAKSVLAS